MCVITRFNFTFFLYAVTISAFVTPATAQQAALEEIVVTAQRREQSLQEVPVSLEVFTGTGLIEQGFNTLTDLAAISTSAEIRSDMIGYTISIRGMGSTGSALSTEQSATTFIDGIHLGRGSMSHGSYFDLQQVEILRGPQPVHFGMNATAGAFSLTTKKPGPEWEGDITAEYGNFGRMKLEGGIGGPITDTFGIRVAAKINRFAGHMIV
jgi:outer membrane receptor protein involved in Fe transport